LQYYNTNIHALNTYYARRYASAAYAMSVWQSGTSFSTAKGPQEFQWDHP